jgi:hypothetical protein
LEVNMPEFNYASGWQDAGAQVQGIGANMSRVALAVARQRYVQAAQQQREALAIARLAMQQQVANSTMQRNAASMDKSQMDAAMTGEKMSAANQLGMAAARETGMRGVPSVEDIASGGGPTLKGADMSGMVNKAMLAGASQYSRGLFGKGVDTYAMHNVPQGDVTVNPMGDVMAVGQPKQFAPGNEKSSLAALYRSAASFVEKANAPDPITGQQNKSLMMTPQYTNAMRVLRTVPLLMTGEKEGGDNPKDVSTEPPGGMKAASKHPTKSMAADYVKKYGSPEAAKKQLQSEGWDISDYAD